MLGLCDFCAASLARMRPPRAALPPVTWSDAGPALALVEAAIEDAINTSFLDGMDADETVTITFTAEEVRGLLAASRAAQGQEGSGQ